MISEVVVGNIAYCWGLLLVALEDCDQAQEYEYGYICETNIGGGDEVLCLQCLDSRRISSGVMVGNGTCCHGPSSRCMVTVPKEWAHDDRAQEHRFAPVLQPILKT